AQREGACDAMTTTHARALEESFYRTLRETPQMALSVAEARNHILDGGFYTQEVVDAAFQKWERDREITLVDAFGFAQVWAHFILGDIAYCSVPVPSGPGADRGRGADDDGLFTIEKGIGLWRTFREPEGTTRAEPWF